MKNLLHSFEGEIVEIDLDDDENSWTGRIAKVFENDVLIVNIDKYGRELAWIAVSIENILLVRSNSNRLNMINGIYPAERQKEYLTSGYSSAAEFLLKYAVERNAYLNVSFKNTSCELFAKGLSIKDGILEVRERDRKGRDDGSIFSSIERIKFCIFDL